MSALSTIRQLFVTRNGRHDLVADFGGADYTDNGANAYIQAGQRYLDIIMPHPKTVGRYVYDIAENDYKLEMQYVQSIESVWIKAASESRKELDRKSYDWLLTNYGDSISDMSSAAPAYYAPIINTLSPAQKALTANDYTNQFTYDYEDITFGANRYVYNGISFRPKADKAYTMTVFARFYSLMASDTDISWHSENFPELLLMASNMMLEVFYRNSAGVQDWLAMIKEFLKGIDNTLINEEYVFATNQMKG